MTPPVRLRDDFLHGLESLKRRTDIVLSGGHLGLVSFGRLSRNYDIVFGHDPGASLQRCLVFLSTFV